MILSNVKAVRFQYSNGVLFVVVPGQVGARRVDPMQRDVWRRYPDARFDLQARDIRHANYASERGRLPKRGPDRSPGAQLQLGPVRQMARLRLGQGKNTSSSCSETL